MQLKETPLWLEGVRFPQGEPGPLPERVDVAVVGAGYTGLAAARELARHGVRVALLEAQTLGAGASARNGGMVLTGLKLDAATLTKRYGLERARQLFAASLAAIDYVERTVAGERIDCAFERTGHLVVASKPAHTRALAAEAELLARAFAHPTHVLARAELPAEIGSTRYYGGLADEISAAVDPARYLAGLAGAAQRAGACLYEHAPVTRIERMGNAGGPGFLLHMPRGRLRAESVFVATGGLTGDITPGLRRRIVPLGSYIIATEPLPEELARDVIPRGRMIFDTRHLLHYFRLTPDRRLLFGGRAGFVPATPRTVRESAAILRHELAQVFPQLRDVPVAYAWGGTLDVAFDMMPHTGGKDGLFFAIGYAGHGVALASYLGAQMADWIAAGRPDILLGDLPFPTAPLGLYDGRPWFLPLAGAWYRVLDLVQ